MPEISIVTDPADTGRASYFWKRIKSLSNRREYLRQRILTQDGEPHVLNKMANEFEAIEWALNILFALKREKDRQARESDNIDQLPGEALSAQP